MNGPSVPRGSEAGKVARTTARMRRAPPCARRYRAVGISPVTVVPPPAVRADLDGPVDRVHPFADRVGAPPVRRPCGQRPAGIDDGEPHDLVGLRDPDGDRAVRPGALGGAAYRVEAAEVHDALDLGRVTADAGAVNRRRDDRTPRHSAERARNPLGTQERRVDPVREVAQIVRRRVDLVGDLGDQLLVLLVAGLAHQPDLHPKRDQALLGALLEVALQAPPLLLSDGQEARPGLPDLVGQTAGLERDQGGGRRRTEELRIVFERRIVEDRGHGTAILIVDRLPAPPSLRAHPRPRHADVGLVGGRPDNDLQRRIVQRSRHLALPPGCVGLALEARHEPFERPAGEHLGVEQRCDERPRQQQPRAGKRPSARSRRRPAGHRSRTPSADGGRRGRRTARPRSRSRRARAAAVACPC